VGTQQEARSRMTETQERIAVVLAIVAAAVIVWSAWT
jgi:hypothetical protein